MKKRKIMDLAGSSPISKKVKELFIKDYGFDKGKPDYFMITLVTLVAISVLLRAFVIGAYVVPTSSMEDTIHVSDCLIGNRLAYIGSSPKRGDIITFTKDGSNLVKRVIATEGETVSFANGDVYIDGKKLYEDYSTKNSYPLNSDITYPYTLKPGEVWVMGDNRTNSADSRAFGPVRVEDIESKIFMKYYPNVIFFG